MISRQRITIGLVGALMIALALGFNLYERLERWIGYSAAWSLDRFFLVGFILAGVLCAMLLLRARETRREASLREGLEAERHEREERLRKLLATTRAVPWEADAHTGRITYIGPQAQDLLGHPIERWLEADFWVSHIHPEDRRRAIDYCLDQKARCSDYEFEYRWLTDDGRVLWVHEIVHVAFRDGTAEHLHGFMIDVTDRKRAEVALENAHQELEHRVEARTADLRRVNDDLQRTIEEQRRTDEMLRRYQERLRALATELAIGDERERRRIAAELHDRTIQSLGMSRIKLGALLKSRGGAERDELSHDLRHLIEGAIHDTRSLIFELSPPILYELGFEPAAEWLVERFEEREGLAGTFRDDRIAKPVTHDLQVALFQAVRELLENIGKHACATRFEVTLAREREEIGSACRLRTTGSASIRRSSRHRRPHMEGTGCSASGSGSAVSGGRSRSNRNPVPERGCC
ncbi:MAG: PAS domain S-box protein [Acidobacteria bacterium]|nr:PAS domain S-box protein [Acidobacteriota bacterium]